MAAKTILAICASALLVQAISASCIGPAAAVLSAPAVSAASLLAAPSAASLLAAPSAASLLAAPCASANIAVSSSGGPFVTTSSSPLSPTGISVRSDNGIEGPLGVAGVLPFLSAVELEGQTPSAGAGAVSYSCGDGVVGIVGEGLAAPLASAALAPAYGPALASGFAPAYGPALASPGFGPRIGAGYASPLAYGPSCY